MAFSLTLDTDNAAFEDGLTGHEVARILRSAADRLEQGEDSGQLRDVNGNTVGSYLLSVGAAVEEPEVVEDDEDGGELYEVVRFWKDGDNEVVETDLTLKEAKAAVNAPGTSGEGWFLGYRAL